LSVCGFIKRNGDYSSRMIYRSVSYARRHDFSSLFSGASQPQIFLLRRHGAHAVS